VRASGIVGPPPRRSDREAAPPHRAARAAFGAAHRCGRFQGLALPGNPPAGPSLDSPRGGRVHPRPACAQLSARPPAHVPRPPLRPGPAGGGGPCGSRPDVVAYFGPCGARRDVDSAIANLLIIAIKLTESSRRKARE